MKSVQERIIKSVYRTYSFIEEDIIKFSEIALQDIDEDMEYEKAFPKAKANITNYIIDELKNNKFSEVFNKAVDKMGIQKAFAIYDMIIFDAAIDIEPEEIYSLGTNEKYKSFYDGVKKTNNYLLKRVLEVYKPNEVEIENIREIYVGPMGNKELDDYMKIVRNIPILDRRQEQELIKKYREAEDEDEKEELKSEFIYHYLGLAASFAFKMHNRKPNLHLGLMDMVQECNTGLVIAFTKFNENLGYRFSTYAMWWIKQTLDRTIDNENDIIRIPVWLCDLIEKKNVFIVEYVNQNGKVPKREEIIEYLGINEDQYATLLKAENIREPLSLDSKIENDDRENRQKSMEIFIADEDTDIENENINKYTREEILRHFSEVLTEKEKKVVCDRLGFNKECREKTLEEIGKELGVVRERVRQIEEKAMKKLQNNTKQIETPEHKPTGRIISKEELKMKLLKKEMKIRVVQFQTQKCTASFECLECGKKFKEDPNDLIKRGYCPSCGENNKQLIKK